MLMVTHDLSDEEAFKRLRLASNRLNTRLADVAARIVADHSPASGGSA
jgi:AmiR/NasT family two-component response regulator